MTGKSLHWGVSARALQAAAVALPVAMLSIGPAFAETASESAATSAANDSGLRVEEVIVTARKREESVQKVPISITAITTQLKTADVRTLSDLVAFLGQEPHTPLNTAKEITLRGMGCQAS